MAQRCILGLWHPMLIVAFPCLFVPFMIIIGSILLVFVTLHAANPAPTVAK